MGDKQFIISKALDEESLDAVKQLIALEDHLSDDATRTTDIRYQKEKDEVRAIRKVLMRRLLHAPETPPPIDIRRKMVNLECEVKHLCLCFVLLTEICDLLSRAGREDDVVLMLGFAKTLNNMLHDYIKTARKILESKDEQTEVK